MMLKQRPAAERYFQVVFEILMDIFIMTAFNLKIFVVNPKGSGRIASILSGLVESFNAYSWVGGVCIWIAVCAVVHSVIVCDEKIDKQILALSGFFSLSYLVSLSYKEYGNHSFLAANPFQAVYALVCLFGWTAVFYFGLRALLLLLKKTAFLSNGTVPRGKVYDAIGAHFFLASFVFIVICWLPWIIATYPGTLQHDTAWLIEEYFGYGTMNTHHPPLCSFLLGWCISLGIRISSANLGLFLYVLLQTLAGAAIFAYAMARLYRIGIKMRYCLIGVGYHGLLALWGGCAQWIDKDVIYTYVVVLFTVIVADVVISRECSIKNTIIVAAVGVLTALLRNNGIYAVVPTLIALVFFLNGKNRRNMLIAACSFLIIYESIYNGIYPAVGVVKEAMSDIYSVPFQQTARYIVNYGDEVTQEEREAIDGVLDYENLAELYNPTLSDPVKGTRKGDLTKLPAYFRAWFRMGLKHPGCYIAALLNNSVGYWAPIETGWGIGVDRNYTDDSRYRILVEDFDMYMVSDGTMASFMGSLGYNSTQIPIVQCFYMPGFYTWIILFCALMLIKRKKYRGLIVIIPSFMNILVCTASPVANSVRYMLPVYGAMPFTVGVTVYLLLKD